MPRFRGLLCHDPWKPYCRYACLHSLGNAHHLRELKRAFEQDGQAWANVMQDLLIDCHHAVIDAGGPLDAHRANDFRKRYRDVLGSRPIRKARHPTKPDHPATGADSNVASPVISWSACATSRTTSCGS